MQRPDPTCTRIIQRRNVMGNQCVGIEVKGKVANLVINQGSFYNDSFMKFRGQICLGFRGQINVDDGMLRGGINEKLLLHAKARRVTRVYRSLGSGKLFLPW